MNVKDHTNVPFQPQLDHLRKHLIPRPPPKKTHFLTRPQPLLPLSLLPTHCHQRSLHPGKPQWRGGGGGSSSFSLEEKGGVGCLAPLGRFDRRWGRLSLRRQTRGCQRRRGVRANAHVCGATTAHPDLPVPLCPLYDLRRPFGPILCFCSAPLPTPSQSQLARTASSPFFSHPEQ